MGQNQSTTEDDSEDKSQKSPECDEEYGPEILTISPLPSKPKAHDGGDDESSAENTALSRRRMILLFLLTLLAIIIVGATAPLVYKNLKNEKPEQGANVDYGPTHIRPTPEHQDDREEDDNFSTPNTSTTEQESLAASDYLPKLPFEDVKLPYFTEDVMGGYSNRTEFEEALAEAAKFLVNKVVLQNLGYLKPSVVENLNSNGFTWRGSNEGEEPQDFYDVTDFETNNQEMGVDEADLMKADSEYVYAAYGNYVLVWDKNGNQVLKLKCQPQVKARRRLLVLPRLQFLAVVSFPVPLSGHSQATRPTLSPFCWSTTT